MTRLETLDCDGKKLSIGNNVLLRAAPNELLAGLPDEDKEAIKSQVGKVFVLSDFDEYGHAELEFIDDQGLFHTVWLKTVYLCKQE